MLSTEGVVVAPRPTTTAPIGVGGPLKVPVKLPPKIPSSTAGGGKIPLPSAHPSMTKSAVKIAPLVISPPSRVPPPSTAVGSLNRSTNKAPMRRSSSDGSSSSGSSSSSSSGSDSSSDSESDSSSGSGSGSGSSSSSSASSMAALLVPKRTGNKKVVKTTKQRAARKRPAATKRQRSSSSSSSHRSSSADEAAAELSGESEDYVPYYVKLLQSGAVEVDPTTAVADDDDEPTAAPPRPHRIVKLRGSLEDAIARLDASIVKHEAQLRIKDEGKNVSLSTSKVNYIDPRIVCAFCQRANVPIKKVFTQSLQDKFPWAMNVDPDYHF